MTQAQERKVEIPDIREYGAPRGETRPSTDRRLFGQLLVLTGCRDASALTGAVGASGLEAVLYLDVNDPRGVGLLTLSEDPSVFAGAVRTLVNSGPFAPLQVRTEYTMIGRTYSNGYEQDLEDWLLRKPRRNAFDERWKWAVWYPLRRKGEFETLSKDDQRAILMEHAKLGMSYGAGDLAHDIRLACHGLDAHDNEFVLGVVSSELYPLSRLVQDMRRTQQTSRYIQSMGPFFVGSVFARFPRG